MLLVAASLALLVVYAGIKLLIQTKKESLGSLYRIASWLFIVAGLVTLLTTGACCIALCCKYGMRMMYKSKMMQGHHHSMKDHHKRHKKMMKYDHEEEIEKDCKVYIKHGTPEKDRCSKREGCECVCKIDSMKHSH